jgi:hypothetical protein
MKRLKALTQRTFPGDFRLAWSCFAQAIFGLFLYKFRGKKHQFYELTVQKPFDQFRGKFNFVQFWRVFFESYNA